MRGGVCLYEHLQFSDECKITESVNQQRDPLHVVYTSYLLHGIHCSWKIDDCISLFVHITGFFFSRTQVMWSVNINNHCYTGIKAIIFHNIHSLVFNLHKNRIFVLEIHKGLFKVASV